jgi:hypothetical protein
LEYNRQAEQRFLKEMMQIMDTSHKEIMAETKPRRNMDMMACREITEAHLEEKETMACQEMEAHPEEKLTSVDRKPEAAEERQVPKENAEVIPVREPRKKRRKDRKLAAERRLQMKEWTQGKDGCRRRLATARRGTSHHAEVAQKMQADKKMPRRATVARCMRDIFRPNTTCKEITIRKDRTRDNMVRGTLKRRMSGRRRQLQRKCNEGLSD